MNSLSWFLYLTEVLYNFRGIAGPLFGVFGTLGLIGCSLMSIYYDEDTDYNGNVWVQTKTYPMRDSANSIKRWLLPTWIIVMLIIFLVPSKNTMYMIAASQVGEQIIQLEEVQELGGEAGSLAKDAISLLRQSIQEQLTEKSVEPSKGD